MAHSYIAWLLSFYKVMIHDFLDPWLLYQVAVVLVERNNILLRLNGNKKNG